jgi:hypothetical protein
MGCRGSEVQIFSLRPFLSHVERCACTEPASGPCDRLAPVSRQGTVKARGTDGYEASRFEARQRAADAPPQHGARWAESAHPPSCWKIVEFRPLLRCCRWWNRRGSEVQSEPRRVRNVAARAGLSRAGDFGRRRLRRSGVSSSDVPRLPRAELPAPLDRQGWPALQSSRTAVPASWPPKSRHRAAGEGRSG